MFINVLRNPSHQEVKEKLLLEISQSEAESMFKEHENITVTDYNSKITDKKYKETFLSSVKSSISKVMELNHCKEWEIHNFWFQQYHKNDQHDWHTHGKCQWSMVYFVELPEKSLSTEFFDLETSEIVKPDVQEGDIIIFDSRIPHRSPKNDKNSRKTIISANMSFFDIDKMRLPSG